MDVTLNLFNGTANQTATAIATSIEIIEVQDESGIVKYKKNNVTLQWERLETAL